MCDVPINVATLHADDTPGDLSTQGPRVLLPASILFLSRLSHTRIERKPITWVKLSYRALDILAQEVDRGDLVPTMSLEAQVRHALSLT